MTPTHETLKPKAFWQVAGSVVQGGPNPRWLDDKEIAPLLDDLQQDMEAAKSAGLTAETEAVSLAMAQLMLARSEAETYREAMGKSLAPSTPLHN